MRDDDPTVFSSGPAGSTSSKKAGSEPSAKAGPAPAKADGIVRVRKETAGRGGKTVTAIRGVPGGAAALRDLAGELKRLCGSGGTVKDGVIEIQGDHGERILAHLAAKGLSVKRAGG